jgi:hypothetical protein
MSNHQNKLRLSLFVIFILAALVIIVDFAWPGKVVNDEILEIKSELQQYYNAAGNSHSAYTVVTNEGQFLVTEDFAQSVQGNEKIEYAVSSIFKEVNWYKLPSSKNRSYYSLRTISGLVLPLITITLLLFTFLTKKKLSTLVFVLEALLLADLIFLIV